MAHTRWDATWHLEAELTRLLGALAAHLQRQRRRGRTAAADAVGGVIIEGGEAEGLIAELSASLGADSTVDPAATAAATEGSGEPHRCTEPQGSRVAVASQAALGEGAGAFLPLRHAERVFELSELEYHALLLALAVELDARFGRLIAFLNDHAGRPRPTLGLAAHIAAPDPDQPFYPTGMAERAAVRDGLLDIDGDAPSPALSVRLPAALIDRLIGGSDRPAEPWLTVHAPDPPLLQRLILDDWLQAQLLAWSDAVRDPRGGAAPLLIGGNEGTGRATAVHAALSAGRRPAVSVEITPATVAERMRAARREARWHGGALVVRCGSPQPQPFDWPAVWQSIAPHQLAAVLVPPDQVAEAARAAPRQPAILSIDEPDVALRTKLWRTLLPDTARITDSEVTELAGRFAFGPGRIAMAIERAAAGASLRVDGEPCLDRAALLTAARAVDSATLGPLAQKLPLPFTRDDLIVPPHVAAELDLATAWVRHRHRVLHEWGFVRRVTFGHGLTALFSGPSGTGKTMAAQVLARELNLDLFRIDLSQIMSKYIGETEKNLAQLFGARVGVLFFDEAEVLLGRRHETKDARDRYANIEVAYLLQRMEEYDGVTVLATNRMRDIDEAFIRRLHVVLDFPLPAEADRLRIWQGMLPADAACEPGLDLALLAREFELSGGQIKNAALAGAYLAAADGRAIGMHHLRTAARRELVKSGKVVEGR